MGRFYAKVGKYEATYGDYQWDYIKDKQSLEYYQKFVFDIEVKNILTNEIFDLEIPILDNFIYVTLLKKNYSYRHIDNNLFNWLFYYVKDTLKEKLYVVPYIEHIYDTYYEYKSVKLFLTDANIDKSLNFSSDEDRKIIMKINTIGDVNKLNKLSINLGWCDENGLIY